uniref:Glucuronosyltransferase n=1 Tax=Ascaris lumbricoides TaxID=6252 RepID=A0A0M3HRW5_ASCLU
MRLFITILSLCCYPSYSYKILIYAPKLFHSHVNFLGNIADTLVAAGHDVVSFVFHFPINSLFTRNIAEGESTSSCSF